MKNWIFRLWNKIPDGIRRKPLDLQISIILIMAALSGVELSVFDQFDYLFEESPFSSIIQAVCVSYLLFGSLLIIVGLSTHHKHNSLLSFCNLEMWGWRLIFSSSMALFIAEFFFGTQPGVSLGSIIWILQAAAALLKILQFYNERSKEKRLWIK